MAEAYQPRHKAGFTPVPALRFRRPLRGNCPGCNAPALKWCKWWCKALDPMDYR